MISILWGILGAVLAIGLFAGGFAAGWKLNNFCRKKNAAAAQEALTEEEKQKQKAEMDAFHTLLNYNADAAYGITT